MVEVLYVASYIANAGACSASSYLCAFYDYRSSPNISQAVKIFQCVHPPEILVLGVHILVF